MELTNGHGNPDSQQGQIREDRLNGTCVVQLVPRAVGSRAARNSEAWKATLEQFAVIAEDLKR